MAFYSTLQRLWPMPRRVVIVISHGSIVDDSIVVSAPEKAPKWICATRRMTSIIDAPSAGPMPDRSSFVARRMRTWVFRTRWLDCTTLCVKETDFVIEKVQKPISLPKKTKTTKKNTISLESSIAPNDRCIRHYLSNRAQPVFDTFQKRPKFRIFPLVFFAKFYF